MTREMAGEYERMYFSNYSPSVVAPVFGDINRYLPEPGIDTVFSPLKRRYPKPVDLPSVHKPKNKNQAKHLTSTDVSRYLPVPDDDVFFSPRKRRYPKPVDMHLIQRQKDHNNQSKHLTKSSSTAKSPSTSGTPSSEHETSLKVNVQRTLSVSSGDTLYGNGELHMKRPPKRRHHSNMTPGCQDDIPVEAKKAKRSYSNSATNTARFLRFHPFDAEPPVFTPNTLSVEIEEECKKCLQTTTTLEKKLRLKSFLEETLSPIYPGCSLHLCGSSSNGFGSDSSDADFCFQLRHIRQSNNRREALPVLRQLQRLLNNDPTYSFLSECQVIPASVPILKFVDNISGCECDININNTVGVRNTHLLRAYCVVDSRVKPMVMLVKKWAKTHSINDASQGTLSSYALTLMVIHYLQGVCKPAVVPVLQRQYPKVFKYHGDVSELEDPFKHISRNKSENKQSLGELFIGFFKYYAVDYGWDQEYISVAKGAAYPRYQRMWQRKHICIEEPFDGNNVAKSVCSLESFNKIQMKFRLAWHTLKISPSLESIKVT